MTNSSCFQYMYIRVIWNVFEGQFPEQPTYALKTFITESEIERKRGEWEGGEREGEGREREKRERGGRERRERERRERHRKKKSERERVKGKERYLCTLWSLLNNKLMSSVSVLGPRKNTRWSNSGPMWICLMRTNGSLSCTNWRNCQHSPGWATFVWNLTVAMIPYFRR